MSKILPNITTISQNQESKLKELEALNIEEAALFLTTLDYSQRQNFYPKLEKSALLQTPVVHLREDSTPREIEYLIQKFGAKVFNIHPTFNRPLVYNLDKFKDKIYIENTYMTNREATKQELEKYAGICLDVSHLEVNRLTHPEKYNYIINLLKKYPIGFWHVSEVANSPKNEKLNEEQLSNHWYEDLNQFDYIIKYKDFLVPYIAIELENPISEQLKVKQYIRKLLGI